MKNAWEKIKLATPGAGIASIKKTVAGKAAEAGVKLLTDEEIYSLLKDKKTDFNGAIAAVVKQLPEDLPENVKKDYAKIKITEVGA